MQLTITRPIVDALKTLKDVPDSLRARIDGIVQVEGGWLLKLSDDDGTALAELLQWHMRTDPATGKPTGDSAAFGELVRLIDEAQFS
jgi:hypothetical protein